MEKNSDVGFLLRFLNNTVPNKKLVRKPSKNEPREKTSVYFQVLDVIKYSALWKY